MKNFAAFLSCCFCAFTFFCFCACVTDDEPRFPNTAQGNFHALWEIIDTRYCYLDYKKIDWDSVKTAYEPRLQTVTNKYELFDLLAAMLAELKDGHVNLYSEFDRSRYWKWFSDFSTNFNSSIVFSDKYLGENYRIAGGFRYGKIASGAVGYMYYSDFSTTFSERNLNEIFTQFKDCQALIVDVRNNGGGLVTSAESLASCFFETETLTGYICHKTGKGHSDFSALQEVKTPANLHWKRPVAVLTNRMSYSATNDFVNRMKSAPNAIIVGDYTGGGGGMPISSELPNGWLVRFSAVPMFDTQKNHTEWGIKPDIQANMNENDTQSDAIIEKAIEELRTKN